MDKLIDFQSYPMRTAYITEIVKSLFQSEAMKKYIQKMERDRIIFLKSRCMVWHLQRLFIGLLFAIFWALAIK